MKKIFTVIFTNVIVFLLFGSAFAQTEQKNPFADGKPVGLMFSNFHVGLNKGASPTAFEVTRAYLGYEFQMNKNFSSKILIDIGSPDDVSQYSLLRRFAYFKDAYLQYAEGKLTVRFGIVPLQAFRLQEQVWGHRYIYKTVLDQNGLASSADLGTYINFKASKVVEFDFTAMNGEGFSSPQTDYTFKTGFGCTITPLKGLMIRFYGDLASKNSDQITLVNFLAYQIDKKLAAGFEYNLRYNDKYEMNHDREMFSAYFTYDFNEKFQVFGRYDKINSNIILSEPRPWSIDQDGSSIIAGVQYCPIPKVKLAIDYQDWYPYAKNISNESFIYFNLEFRVW